MSRKATRSPEIDYLIAGLDDDLREIISDFICQNPGVSKQEYRNYFQNNQIHNIISEEMDKLREE